MQLPDAHGPPLSRGVIKSSFEDFSVTEILGFVPPDHGEHWFLWIEKRGATTPWIAKRLSALANCHVREIGYSGLKDRNAVSRQWFSLPGATTGKLPPAITAAGDFSVHSISRNPKKLKRGTHRGNHFRLLIRDVCVAAEQLDARLALIAGKGVPNYFGMQRFGRDGNNLKLAGKLFAGAGLKRSDRGFALSAARSAIFNRIVARRIERSCWDSLIAGDHANLDGRGSVFAVTELSDELDSRCRSGEIHPTGTLWGAEGSLATGEAAAIERAAAAELPELKAGLAASDVRSRYRALRLIPSGIRHELNGSVLELEFSLPAGAFATTVLNEIFDIVDSSQAS